MNNYGPHFLWIVTIPILWKFDDVDVKAQSHTILLVVLLLSEA